MRVRKKISLTTENAIATSRAFDGVMQTIDIPLHFDLLEFTIGSGFTEIDENRAIIGLDADDVDMAGGDEKAARALVAFEVFRAFMRPRIGDVPRAIEDVMIGREMCARGYADDLASLFYIFIQRHRVADKKDFLRLNLPWLAFHGVDPYNAELFKKYASVARFEHSLRFRKLFAAMKRDLWRTENLIEAIKFYEVAMRASD